MNLRQKTLCFLTLTLTGLMVTLSGSLSSILLKNFSELERRYTEENVQRLQSGIDNELDQIDRTAKDWSAWDETYEYLKGNNPQYIENNFYDSTYQTLQINIITFFNLSGKTISQQGFNLEKNKPFSLHDKLDSELQLATQKSQLRGFLLINKIPTFVVIHPILDNTRTKPSSGFMMMGRYLTSPKIKDIAKNLKLDISLYSLSETPLNPDLTKIKQDLLSKNQNHSQAKPIIVQIIDENWIAGYTLFKDIHNQPILIAEIKLQRDIYKQGKFSLNSVIYALIVVGLFFSIGLMILLDRTVVSRITRLSKTVNSINSENDISQRLEMTGKDEISSLATQINQMLDTIEISAKALQQEQKKTENLLLNMLPEEIAGHLKQNSTTIAHSFSEVTILFADIVGFTKLATHLPPQELVDFLNEIFSAFDMLTNYYQLEKIKTIGDAYMVVGGVPLPNDNHAIAIAQLALEMREIIKQFSTSTGDPFEIRIGINTGSVVAGVIGLTKFAYDLWGDAVNIASRMESSGEPGRIQVTETTYQKLFNFYEFEPRGMTYIKGKGEMMTYWLLGEKNLIHSPIFDVTEEHLLSILNQD